MGQVQSDLYECELAAGPGDDQRRRRQPLARGKISDASGDGNKHKAAHATKTWHTNQMVGLGGKKKPKAADKAAATSERLQQQQQQQQREQQHSHIRKLSNVSNRNIQLLSMKPRSEKDTYADGLRSRRRSSLINLILGAPARGPRFSEDLCSLSSHMSELCNFGIDYFPDSTPQPPTQAGGKQNRHHHDVTQTMAGASRGRRSQRQLAQASINSSSSCLSRLEANASEADLCPGSRGFGPLDANWRRRGSSLGSLTSFETTAATDGAQSDPRPDSDQSNGTTGWMRARDGQKTRCEHAESRSDARTYIQLDGVHRGGHVQPAVDLDTSRKAPSLRSTILASVDLTSSLDETSDKSYEGATSAGEVRHDDDDGQSVRRYYSNEQETVTAVKKTSPPKWVLPARMGPSDLDGGGDVPPDSNYRPDPSGAKTKQTATGALTTQSTATSEQIKIIDRQVSGGGFGAPLRGRINHTARRMMIHRSGSELSLYSTASGGSLSRYQAHFNHAFERRPQTHSQTLGAVGDETRQAKGKSAHLHDLNHAAKFVATTGSGNDWSPTATNSTATSTNAGTGGSQHLRETKLIIMLQVCLPFILAGFGNMGAGLALNQIAHWEAFRHVPTFFVLLPSFVGLKGNIEMTLASRLSTLSNLNLLDTGYQRRCALLTNLILILGQAIGLCLFAVMASVACEFLIMGKQPNMQDHGGTSELVRLTSLVVLPAALISIMTLVVVSSVVMWFAIWLAKKLQVNPDNLSTLMAALYGDVSCVLTYGLFAQLMYSLNQDGVIIWPVCIICLALVSWPLLVYIAYQCRETQALALSSMPPMLAAIVVSLGSGAVLSLVVDKFSRVALYQPVVNGFGANLIAVQASRVSTWLWCNALERTIPMASAKRPRQKPKPSAGPLGDGLKFEFEPSDKMPYDSLASFTDLTGPRLESEIMVESRAVSEQASKHNGGCCAVSSLATGSRNLLEWCIGCGKLLLWSFLNPSPNSVAARLLLVMLIPAHSLYFVVIWLVAPSQYIHVTWPFYLVYISLCAAQVFVLLSICQPLMTLLMFKHLDPDIFGISLLMALADLIGTICLTGGFYLLAGMGDPNAI